ncbi:hypothetical protein EJB05_23531, partial [Eragrostis curvula]
MNFTHHIIVSYIGCKTILLFSTSKPSGSGQKRRLNNIAGMEAAVASGILKIVSNKLAPLLMKEYSSLMGAKKDLQELHGQVMEINSWLERVVDKAVVNDRSFNWLKQLQDIAYDVENIVDEFQLKAEKHETGGDAGIISKYLCTKPKSVMFQCKTASKIKAIKNKFAAIVKQRNDLNAITNSLPVGHLVHHMNMTVGEMPLWPNINAASVLGREKEKHELISKLVETKEQQLTNIVSIIGLGGSGKTTLSKLVFNDDKIIEKHFQLKLWIHVSQEFDVAKLAGKLFEAIVYEKSEQHTFQYISTKISEKLTGKKYLLVLDDIWIDIKDQIQWDQFMVHLRNGAPGSGILLTTRSREVARTVRSTDQFVLPFLSLGHSWQLFQQSIEMPPKGWDFKFEEVGKEIIKKCGGVPLAIKVLAGALGGKDQIEEWQAMRDSNFLDVNGEEHGRIVFACLKLSYFHLPSHLKQCFTICSVFPKGDHIYKQQLIDQWIAHDMIGLTPGVDDLELIGHRYFNSLVHVSFLQDVEEYNGKVRCKMHDLVHDLARSILCDEFSTLMPEDATSSAKGYRYFSISKRPRNLLPEKVFENARAIYVDRGDDIIFGKALKNARHLRSIIVRSISSTAVLTAIFQVKNLKYLEICVLRCKALSEAISDVWSLQALYISSGRCLLELPKSIGMLAKLRKLSLSRCSELKSLPSGMTTLQNLEYLKLEECDGLLELPEGIGNLTKLKALDLDVNKAMPPGIGHLTRLEKLNSFIVEFDKKYAQISELANLSRISGKLTIYFLRRVTDPCDARQACLKQKKNLHELELSWGSLHSSVDAKHEVAVIDGLEPPSGITSLKIDTYGGGKFAWWMQKQVVGGVHGLCEFPFLTRMSLADFPNLKHLDGLVQLPCLEKLHLMDMPALESISGGPFPSLVVLKLNRLRSLGEVWMVTDTTLFINGEGEGSRNYSPHQSGQVQFVQLGSHLTNLYIQDCPKLRVKPYFPISLKQLNLEDCDSNLPLSSCQSEGSSSSSNSPPSFSHLKVLKLLDMKALSSSLSPPPPIMLALESLEIFLCNDLIELPECLGQLCSLQKMSIKNCASLNSLPQSIGRLTSLQVLVIKVCDALVQFPEGLGELCSLRYLEISRLGNLTCLPQTLCHLTSLKELHIEDCEALVQLPEGLGELRSLCKFVIWCLPGLTCLPQSLCRLMSLQELQIGGCHALGELPECLGELVCLRRFKICGLRSLTCLPQSLCCLTASLKELEISACLGIKSLPEGIKGLTALQRLKIDHCPDLAMRCKRGMGEDWHLISRIPRLEIDEFR